MLLRRTLGQNETRRVGARDHPGGLRFSYRLGTFRASLLPSSVHASGVRQAPEYRDKGVHGGDKLSFSRTSDHQGGLIRLSSMLKPPAQREQEDGVQVREVRRQIETTTP